MHQRRGTNRVPKPKIELSKNWMTQQSRAPAPAMTEMLTMLRCLMQLPNHRLLRPRRGRQESLPMRTTCCLNRKCTSLLILSVHIIVYLLL